MSSVARTIATFLARSGVRRVYGLTGSHIKPIWDEAARLGIRIVDVRHEVAAVHMAQADADLTGELAVVTVTTGPGLTNAVSGIVAAHQARSPLLVLSALPPSGQLGLGALEELDQAGLVSPVTRLSRTISNPRQVLPFLAAAFSAAVGDDGPAGPVYLDVPTDVLRGPDQWSDLDTVTGARRRPLPLSPPDEQVAAAAALLATARRPVVVSGRGASAAALPLQAFLEATGALYLDTTESRGLVPSHHPASVPAMRSKALTEADLVITLGRRLDFSLAFGSPVLFRTATALLRVGRTFDELGENRPGDVQVQGDVGPVLDALLKAGAAPADLDQEWREDVRRGDAKRRTAWTTRAVEQPIGPDGAIHPNAVIHAINEAVRDRDALLVADGGDVLSFARVGLDPPARLDTGTFGCLGVGVPQAIAASLLHPDKTVVALVGDGSFGFNAVELDTARRTGAKPLIVISNNEAWNIERLDHVANYADNPGFNTRLPGCRYDLLAQAFGLHAERVTDVARLGPAIEEALAHLPAVLDVRTSGEVPSPDFAAGLADLAELHVLTPWDTEERSRLQSRRQGEQ